MSRTILLADDSLTIQKVVELTFADTEYEVIAVSSGDELLERLPEAQPDIVICDVIMPGRDGYDVCQEIKSSSETLHLPVILLTGTFEPFDRDRALAAGCSEIITKPFEAKKLVETVENLSSVTGAPPPPTASEEEDAVEFDGQVTPPPPMVAPEMSFEAEDEEEFEESDVRHEFAAEEAAAETPDELVVAETEESKPDYFDDETPVFVAAAVSVALDLDSDEEDSLELPDVEEPPDDAAFADQPREDLDTLASNGGIELDDAEESELALEEDLPEDEFEDPFSAEATEPPPDEMMDEPVAPEADNGDSLESSIPELEEPETDEESGRDMTKPIDVASVMAEADAEKAPTSDDGDVESIEVDLSDADTQDLTERADEEEDAVAAEAPGEQIAAETPAESFEVEVPEEPIEFEAPSEVFEPEPPTEEIAADSPSDPFVAETAAESFEAEVPEEPVVITAAEEPVAAVPPPKPAAFEAVSLSEDDIDRIARRLLELAGDRIEHIAWDVIPDMAEIVVRERVRELEAEAEQ